MKVLGFNVSEIKGIQKKTFKDIDDREYIFKTLRCSHMIAQATTILRIYFTSSHIKHI